MFELVLYFFFAEGPEQRRVLSADLIYEQCQVDREKLRTLMMLPNERIECETEA